MYRSDSCPAERRRGNGCGHGALRAGDDAEVPLAFGGRRGDVLHHLLELLPLGIGLVTDLQHGAAGLDPVAVDVASEQLAAVEPARDRHWHLGAHERRLPEQRRLAVKLLCRDARAVRQLERYRLPLVRDDELELDEIGALVRGGIDDGERAARNLRRDSPHGALRQLAADLFGLGVAREHAALRSIRAETTPGSRFARAAERSSPRQVVSPSAETPARYSASVPTGTPAGRSRTSGM